MKTASFIFAMIAASTGLAAAYYWYKSSGFNIGPLGPKWDCRVLASQSNRWTKAKPR